MSEDSMDKRLLLELITTQREIATLMGETKSAVKALEQRLIEHVVKEEKDLEEIRRTQSKHEALINQAKGARYAILGLAALVSGVVSFFFGKH